MKLFGRYLFAGLTILALTGVIALAKVKQETVTFTSDVTVGSTTVKAGTYDLRFDEQTGDLEIVKGSKVVAKASTHVEKRSEKARTTEIHTTTNGSVDQLTSIAFRGKDENIIVGQSSQSATGQD
jgi:hypothetical protein